MFSMTWKLFVVDSRDGTFVEGLLEGHLNGSPELVMDITGSLVDTLQKWEPKPKWHLVLETVDNVGNKVTITNMGKGNVSADFGNVLPDLDFEGMEDDRIGLDENHEDDRGWEDHGKREPIDSTDFPF